MPKVFDWNGYRFHFYSFEGDPPEPAHVHVAKPGADAKFWLLPEVRLARNSGMSAIEIRRLQKVVTERRGHILEAWRAFFGQ